MDFGDIACKDIKISFDVIEDSLSKVRGHSREGHVRQLQSQLLEKEVENNIVKCKLQALERHHLKSINTSRAVSPLMNSQYQP